MPCGKALEATLLLYLQPERLARELPTLRWLTRAQADIAATAQALMAPLTGAVAPRYTVTQVSLMSQIGSGSLPVDLLPSAGLAIAPVLHGKRGVGTALDVLSVALRELPVPVVGRIEDDRFILDCRCLDDVSSLVVQLAALRERLAT